LLLLMVLIWGANFSVIKRAFEEMPPQPFNALRMVIASVVFLAAIAIAKRLARRGDAVSSVLHTPNPLTTRDRIDLVWLGLVGHFGYQFFFVGGVSLTSASNAALIVGATPAALAVVSALMGRERISRLHWAGAAISALGIYLVVGHGASFGGTTLRGDLLVICSVACWVTFTLGAASLITRHSPLYVTGMTMVFGGIPYVVMALPQILRVPWADVSTWTLSALVLSALLALNLAYVIWYMGVQRLGPARTSIYSNGVPIVAMAVATVWLGEPLTGTKVAGAAAVLSGVLLTRLGRRFA
ncbi:MAG: DMT family transporter, partial [Acidobacteria bacterium]|nr:DMT family transporter [Acidobacteriota bacterium]